MVSINKRTVAHTEACCTTVIIGNTAICAKLDCPSLGLRDGNAGFDSSFCLFLSSFSSKGSLSMLVSDTSALEWLLRVFLWAFVWNQEESFQPIILSNLRLLHTARFKPQLGYMILYRIYRADSDWFSLTSIVTFSELESEPGYVKINIKHFPRVMRICNSKSNSIIT